MKNPGFNPFADKDNPPMIDIKFRNGEVARGVDPSKFRWAPWKPGYQGHWDISDYQEVK